MPKLNWINTTSRGSLDGRATNYTAQCGQLILELERGSMGWYASCSLFLFTEPLKATSALEAQEEAEAMVLSELEKTLANLR